MVDAHPQNQIRNLTAIMQGAWALAQSSTGTDQKDDELAAQQRASITGQSRRRVPFMPMVVDMLIVSMNEYTVHACGAGAAS